VSADAYIHHAEGEGAALLFLFHGTGGNEMQFVPLAHELLPGARLVAPRGDVSEAGALRYFRRMGEGRYDMNDLARATAKMAGFVSAQRGEAKPVIGLGYSNGANILAAVMFEHPELFDAAVLMHPLIPFEPHPQPGLQGKSMLITAGEADPIAPALRTEALELWFREQGAAVETVWHEGGHGIDDSEIAAVASFLGRVVA
jgi:phospholipase/carboxylesterase